MSHNKHSKMLKTLYIASEIMFLILAILLGFVFKSQTLNLYEKPSFNWGLAIVFYLSSVPLTALLYAVYSHLENQEIQIKLLDKISKEIKEAPKNITPASSIPEQNSGNKPNASWICKECNDKNPADAKFCKGCGTYRNH